MSAEGNFRVTGWGPDGEDLRPRLPSPVPNDAIDVELAVRLLPLNHHLLLKLRYHGNGRGGPMHDDADLFACWRRATGERLNLRLLEEMEASAIVNLRAALELPQVIRKERSLRLVKRLLRKAIDEPDPFVPQSAADSTVPSG
jgi:hypothetical protein